MASPAAQAPVTELGHGGVSSWGQLGRTVDDGEETPAVTWPESVRTYSRMRNNSTVHTVLTVLTQPILRPGGFALDPQGADPARAALLAEDLDLPLLGQERQPPLRRRGRFSWLDHARLALLCDVFGHMAFELVCDPDALEATGMARLRKLAPRFPQTIAEIHTARDGGLESIVQWPSGTVRPEPIPVDRLVWYARNREGAAWWGRSTLRPCYGDWLLLDRYLRARAYLIERWGAGMPVFTAQPGADQDVVDAGRDMAAQSRSGDQSAIGLADGQKYSIEGVRGTFPDINSAIADHKAALADSVMASWLRLGTQEASGNRALGQTFVDQFVMAENARAAHLADVATAYVVEDLWDWNYGESDPAPAVVAVDIDAERDIDPTALVALVHAGVITADESLEDLQRQRYRLGRRTPAQEAAPAEEHTPEELAALVNAAGTLIRSGFTPEAALSAVGLDPIKHTGLLPVTVQSPKSLDGPIPNPGVEAARRARPPVRARSATWAERVAQALAGVVDVEAIASAAAGGDEAAEAVEAGLSIEDTADLATLLVELWGQSYNAGAEAATEKVAAGRGRQRRGGRPVMASLADMIAEAETIASGILTSLRDRLVAGIEAIFGSGEADVDVSDIAARLQDLAGDDAAAERVAVTEAHRAEIAGAADTWASMGVVELRWVRTSGSDLDDDCAALDGTVATEFESLPPLHPNCLCVIEPA